MVSSRKDLWDWCKQRNWNERDNCPLDSVLMGRNSISWGDVHPLEGGLVSGLLHVPDSV